MNIVMPDAFVSYTNDSTCWADLEWWNIYSDTNLRNLIDYTLENNKDMKIAVAKVKEMTVLNPEIRRRQTGVRASQTPQRQIRGGKSDQANRPAVDLDKRLQTESGEIRNTDSIHHCAGQG